MRPPEHWHLRSRRKAVWPWWALGALCVLAIIAGAFCMRAAGGSDAPSTVAAAPTPCDDPTGCGSQATPESFGSEGAAPGSGVAAGRSIAVIEASCGALLYGQNEHGRRPPASLTKMATALVAIERAGLDETVEVQVNSGLLVASTASTVMGLEPGMRLTMRDLLHGLLLVSGNDAAIAIAEYVGGTTRAFVDLMNAEVAELGLRDTRFANPHGLDDTAHYSTAYDMAMLGRALLADPELAAVVRTKSYEPEWDGGTLWNGNELLELYPGAIGVKTGYTEAAGQTFVAAAERDGRRLIVAVLGSFDRYADAAGLFDWAFANSPPSCTADAALGGGLQ